MTGCYNKYIDSFFNLFKNHSQLFETAPFKYFDHAFKITEMYDCILNVLIWI